MGLTYAIREIRENGTDIYWWEQRLLHRIVKPAHERFLDDTGCPVVEKDWDNLLILDGCRHDLYESVADESIQSTTSLGSSTPEFLQKNFSGKQFDDTVYITANPQVNRHVPDSFVDIVNVWEDYWNDKWSTVMPEDVAAVTRDVADQYPNKRLIIHFMQPHYPFIDYPEILYDGLKIRDEVRGDYDETNTQHITPWTALARGDTTTEEVSEAYHHNLELVLPIARSLADDLEGKSVITSDHGNGMGEFLWPFPVRIYGHTDGIHAPELLKVPWEERPFESRRTITSTAVRETAVDDDSVVSDRLRDLGYV